MEIIVTILVGLMMLTGLLGAIIPFLPDVVLIWVGALIYGLVTGWGQSGGWLFGIISVLGLVGLLSDAWVSGAGARQGGATVLTTLGGLAIGLVALFTTGPLGFSRHPAGDLRPRICTSSGSGASLKGDLRYGPWLWGKFSCEIPLGYGHDHRLDCLVIPKLAKAGIKEGHPNTQSRKTLFSPMYDQGRGII